MMKYFSTLLVALFAVGILFSLPDLALAQSGFSPAAVPPSGNAPAAVPPSGYTTNAVVVLEDPLGNKNFCELARSLLNVVMALGVPVAVLFLVWSGFRFILARGNEKELGDAKRNFKFVIVGIALFMGAWTFTIIVSSTIQALDQSGKVQFCGRT